MIVSAFLYKSQPKTYTASGTILVRDEGNKVKYQSRNMDAILSNMGMDNTNLSLENEIYMLKSSWLMSQVVSRLGLNYSCSRNDMFKKVTYFKDAPLALTIHDNDEKNRDITFRIKVKPKANNKYEYTAYKYDKKVSNEAYYSQPVKFDDTVSFTIEKTPFYTNDFENVNLNMGVTPKMALARNMLKSLSVSRVDKMASIISLTYNDSNRERANQIVDTLIAVYNDDAIEDKNKVAQKTEQFISERIALISGELDVVDAQVESIKLADRPALFRAGGAVGDRDDPHQLHQELCLRPREQRGAHPRQRSHQRYRHPGHDWFLQQYREPLQETEDHRRSQQPRGAKPETPDGR